MTARTPSAPVSGRSALLVVVVFAVSMAAMMGLAPPIWPLAQLGMLLPAALVVWRVPALRPLAAEVSRGTLRWPLVLLIAGSSATALVGWARLANPDLSAAQAMVPDAPAWLLILGALGFAGINAALEEVAFRGLLQPALGVAFGPLAAVLLQAVAFGVAHLHGVPNGPLGAAMAGTWALVLGWARNRSGGLVTPILGHIIADLVIFALLASS